MNRNKVNGLIENMVKVVVTETDTMINNSNLIVKVKTDNMTGRIIAKSIAKYSMDWSSDIIRDQVIATIYESMLIVSKDMDIEKIHLDNPEFVGKVNILVDLKLKETLIPKSKKNKDGKVIGYKEEAVSPIAENGEATSKLEQLLNGDIEKLMMNGEKEKMNQFLNWFNDNKKNILTRKQLMFIDGELFKMDKRRVSEMRKRIADRVSKAYTEKYGTVTPRIATLMDQKEVIENILEADDFKAALLPYMEELFIIDTIIDNVSPRTAKAFNTGSTETWVIREYRIALFKALGNIINILDREGI